MFANAYYKLSDGRSNVPKTMSEQVCEQSSYDPQLSQNLCISLPSSRHHGGSEVS